MRQILGLYPAPRGHWVGDGFPVRSLFSHHSHGMQVSPFLLLDHAGPHTFAPGTSPRGVGQHPHRGFETVTFVYDGEVEHRDSTGASGTIGPGDVQWMTAASGVLHEEMHSKAFTENGGTLEMVQLWVNLPARHKMAKPGYQTLLKRDIPEVTLPDGAGTLRVVAGGFGRHKGPARTFTPIEVWDLRLNAGRATELTLPEGHTLLVVVLAGTVEANKAATAREAELVLLSREGGAVKLEAKTDAKVLVLAGEPIDEPVVAQGPFVMSTLGEIKQAMLDYRSGRFGSLA